MDEHKLILFQPDSVVDNAEKYLFKLQKELDALKDTVCIKFPLNVQQKLSGTKLIDCEYDKEGFLEKVTLTDSDDRSKRMVFTRTECKL